MDEMEMVRPDVYVSGVFYWEGTDQEVIRQQASRIMGSVGFRPNKFVHLLTPPVRNATGDGPKLRVNNATITLRNDKNRKHFEALAEEYPDTVYQVREGRGARGDWAQGAGTQQNFGRSRCSKADERGASGGVEHDEGAGTRCVCAAACVTRWPNSSRTRCTRCMKVVRGRVHGRSRTWDHRGAVKCC